MFPQRMRFATATSLVLLGLTNSTPDSLAKPGVDSFLRGEFLEAAKHLNDEGLRRQSAISSMAGADVESALNIIDEELQNDVGSAEGPWIEGRFVSSWVRWKKAQLQDLSYLESIVDSFGDSLHVRYILADQALRKGSYERALELLAPFKDRQHPLEYKARVLRASALSHRSKRNPELHSATRQDLQWLSQQSRQPRDQKFFANLGDHHSSIEQWGSGNLEDRMSFESTLAFFTGPKVVVEDAVLGLDPLAARNSLVAQTRLSGNLVGTVLRRAGHHLYGMYAATGHFHFSTDLKSYDRLIHGLKLGYEWDFDLEGLETGLRIQHQVIDVQGDFSSFRQMTFAHVHRAAIQLHLSSTYSTQVEAFLAGERTQNYTATNANDPTFVNQTIYQSDMSGLKMGGSNTHFLHFEESFFFQRPMDLSITAGVLRVMAQADSFSKTAFFGELTSWVPLRWQFLGGISALYAFQNMTLPAQGSYMYTEGHFYLKKLLSPRSHILFDTSILWKRKAAPNTIMAFQLLLQGSYRF